MDPHDPSNCQTQGKCVKGMLRLSSGYTCPTPVKRDSPEPVDEEVVQRKDGTTRGAPMEEMNWSEQAKSYLTMGRALPHVSMKYQTWDRGRCPGEPVCSTDDRTARRRRMTNRYWRWGRQPQTSSQQSRSRRVCKGRTEVNPHDREALSTP